MKQFYIAVVLASIAATACASGMTEEQMSQEQMSQEQIAQEQTIVEIAATDARFSTLVAALEAADLVETLSGDGPFTVFAPTDEAFAHLPDGTVEALLADPDALSNILTYHVVAGRVVASEVMGLTHATTVQGQPIVVGTSGGVSVNQARVTQTDITGSNGVIHVIDTVLLPPGQNIVEVAIEAGSFQTLVAAVQAAGLADTLSGGGPFTVFAPTDEAFAKLPDGTVEALLADPEALADILMYHVVAGRVFSGDVVQISRADTSQGTAINVSSNMDGVVLNGGSNVVATDILATNGVIHVIDTVLLPE